MRRFWGCPVPPCRPAWQLRLAAALPLPSLMSSALRSACALATPQGAVINVLGAGATMLGLSATIGVLLAKTLTSATINPFLATSSTNWNPVLAFDVFNVQVRCRRRSPVWHEVLRRRGLLRFRLAG